MCDFIKNYFTTKKYQYHLFRIIGFSRTDYKTFKIVSVSKADNAANWYFNNFLFPIAVFAIPPLVLSLIHYCFATVPYHRTFVEIMITGSFTLIGINVLRAASTIISQQDEPPSSNTDLSNYQKALKKVNQIRNKLTRSVWILTGLGSLLYFLQVGQFLNDSSRVIYAIIAAIVLLTLISIIYGRFIFMMKSNILDDTTLTNELFGSLLNQRNDFEDLKSLFNDQGII